MRFMFRNGRLKLPGLNNSTVTYCNGLRLLVFLTMPVIENLGDCAKVLMQIKKQKIINPFIFFILAAVVCYEMNRNMAQYFRIFF